MKYRVQFRFPFTKGYYFTEWFDTLGEAQLFVDMADMTSGVVIHSIEDSNHEIV